MSERKSWDVVRKPAPAAQAHPVATHAPVIPNGPRRGKAVRPPTRPLKEKRKEERRMFWFVALLIACALIGGIFYLLWLPAARVNTIDAQGPDAQGVQQVTMRVIAGTYFQLLPRNSVFVLPEYGIRAQILKQYPDIEAVSIKPTSLHSIRITSIPRAAAFVWCGTSVDAIPADGACFSADAAGLIFAPVDPAMMNASSTLRIYSPLDRDIAAGDSPIRAYMKDASRIPDALRLVKALRALNAPVSALSIQGDEGDFYLQGPTKVKYVLGHEAQAAELAASSFPKLNLTDGTIDYIDLRFVTTPGQPGKVYVKRFGQ